ncbi:MAG: sigma-70 family RNA polymerase sigma factor [Planctomycetota bacterium]
MSSSCVLRNPPDRCFERFRRRGDPRELAAVFDRTAPELWRVAAHLCRHRHDAEDAVQSTFLAAIEHRDEWDAARPLLPWLLGLLVNRVREQRRRAARTVDATRLAPRPAEDPAERAAQGEFGAVLTASLERLDEPYRSALEQHLVHDKQPHEIAAQAGETAGAVRMRIHRGLDRLRRQLPRAGFATGAVALQMPPATFASVRGAVLATIPGGAALPAYAGLGAIAFMTTTHWWMAGATVAATLSLFLLWPATKGGKTSIAANAAPAAAVTAHTPSPDVQGVPATSAETPTTATRVAAAPIAARGTLRIEVRTAWNDEPIADTKVAIVYGMRPPAPPSRAPESGENLAPPVASSPASDVAGGFENAATDAEGNAHVELPAGRARITVPDFATCPGVEAEVRAGNETECVVRVAAMFTGVVRVVGEDGRPVAGARILGRAVTDSGLLDREFGVTDAAGRWSGPFASAYLFVRAVARGRAASPPVALQKDQTEVTLRLGGAAATVHGTVFGADGAPMANTEVLLHARAMRVSELAPIAVRTSAAGTFTCDYVPAGPCLALAVRRGSSEQWRFTMQDLTATADSPTQVDLRFPVGASLATKFRRPNGDTGGHCNITLVPRHRELPPRLATLVMVGADTDANGERTLDALFPGPYEVRGPSTATGAPATIDLRDGEVRELVLTLTPDEWVEVEFVDDAGEALTGWLAALDGDNLRNGQPLAGNGRVRFDGVAPVAHEVALLRNRSSFPVLTRPVPNKQRTRIVVPRDAMTLSTLRGTIGLANDIEPGDLRVVLMRAEAQLPWQAHVQVNAPIMPATRAFAFDSLPAGTYHLMIATRLAPKAVRTDVRIGADDVDLGVIELGTGGIDLQLVRSDGRPVSEPAVGINIGSGTFSLAAPDSPDGPVSRDLPAAVYQLLAWGRDVEPVVVPVTVRIGERTPVSVTLRPATPTTLVFAGASTQRGMFARITLQRDGAPLLVVLVDPSQPFVRGLVPGAYRVEIDDGSGTHGAADFRVTADPGEPVVVLIAR